VNAETTIRIARATDHLEEIVRFYRDGVGLTMLGSFADHAGFDGVMLGLVGARYHLEFTHARGHVAGNAPTKDNLMVLYLPDPQDWQAAIDRMELAGYKSVGSFNPYWERSGRTFEDPDGYRVVFQKGSWPD
jgi:hypothetical protein